MKKSLIALAVASAAGAAFAQSSVTLYGIADVAYVSKTHTAANGTTLSKTTGIGEGFNAGNRVGFRGTEKLSGGLTASFVIENGINITNPQLFSTRGAAAGQQVDGVAASGNMPAGAYSTGTNRQSFVGLGGGFGEVRLGYQYTTLYVVSTLSGYHFASEQPGGDLSHGTLSNASFGGTRANGLTYISPRMSGLQLTAMYGAGAGRQTVEFASGGSPNGKETDKNNRMSLLANYTAGPLNASAAYTSFKPEANAVVVSSEDATGKITGGTTNIFGAINATAAAAAVKQSNSLIQLAGRYDISKQLRVGVHYSKGKIDDQTSTNADQDTAAYQLGGEYVAGAIRPFVSWGKGSVKTASTGVKTEDLSLVQFGARYDLSPRTVAYIMSGSTKNDMATAATLQKRQATAIGVMHSF